MAFYGEQVFWALALHIGFNTDRLCDRRDDAYLSEPLILIRNNNRPR